MEKGIEAEEDNLYKQTEDVADNVLDTLDGMNTNVKMNNVPNGSTVNQSIDYNKLSNLLYDAFFRALNSCKLTLDEDGFVKFIRNELYEVI